MGALSVSLVTPPSPLVAGTAYTVDCQVTDQPARSTAPPSGPFTVSPLQVVGSLPPPTIHWWLAGQHIPEISKKVSRHKTDILVLRILALGRRVEENAPGPLITH